MTELPKVISLKAEAATTSSYDNHPIAAVNDHVVRISIMTEPFYWHRHPNSDETFFVVEGALDVEFDNGTVRLHQGELLTVPKGTRHRTRPVGERSVNLTIESASLTTDAS